MDLSYSRDQLFDYLKDEILDHRVLEAMKKVPRELFLPQELRCHAYENRPLPIGYGQTISQPLIVAIMTQAMDLSGDEDVLEIGTGSGYQTAILAEMARRVVTVERIEELLKFAKENLAKLGYKNIEFRIASDVLGCPEYAPYDAIIVTAGAPHIPESLLEQLKIEGRMVIPVGDKYEQELLKVIRHKDKNTILHLGYCRFVPLIGSDAW